MMYVSCFTILIRCWGNVILYYVVCAAYVAGEDQAIEIRGSRDLVIGPDGTLFPHVNPDVWGTHLAEFKFTSQKFHNTHLLHMVPPILDEDFYLIRSINAYITAFWRENKNNVYLFCLRTAAMLKSNIRRAETISLCYLYFLLLA